jgi:hypothetical protein
MQKFFASLFKARNIFFFEENKQKTLAKGDYAWILNCRLG